LINVGLFSTCGPGSSLPFRAGKLTLFEEDTYELYNEVLPTSAPRPKIAAAELCRSRTLADGSTQAAGAGAEHGHDGRRRRDRGRCERRRGVHVSARTSAARQDRGLGQRLSRPRGRRRAGQPDLYQCRRQQRRHHRQDGIGRLLGLHGGTGDEVAHRERRACQLYGDAGNDTLEGGAGDDLLDGGADSDLLRGRGGRDTLRGRDGEDRLDGGEDDDILDGGAGSDRYTWEIGAGNDQFVESAGGTDSDQLLVNGARTTDASGRVVDANDNLLLSSVGGALTIGAADQRR
jgi:hypothetical protein